ncbi:M20 metallopeptidase family protein [Altibacter sp. HG106]|uniref:M20 metallopeptidase family protein n=1 Tax=Altibacter sp. HG106 TaxID=3023937 RepID=UPI00234FECFB|nr:M20 family metallopeptidase [Altibacter sp. HG106]MDC7995668.1 M20 family metallopeptidase [Altibacter sp. HG106]
MKTITLTSIVLSICLYCCSYAQQKPLDNTLHQNIQKEVETLADTLIRVRRHLYQYPEVSGEEKQTARFVAAYLKRIGLEVHTGIGGYGVVGILRGAQDGPKIAWRADMDALPSKDPDPLPFASKHPGKRHQCGHDVHTTIALGIASALSKVASQLRGTVYFIFQPSEENYKGAAAMMDDGLFDLIQPDEIYGAHIAPMASGLITTKPNYIFATYRQLKLTFTQDDTVTEEEVVAEARSLLAALQTVEKESPFWDNRNLLSPEIGVGSPNTIFKDYITVAEDMPFNKEKDSYSVSGYLTMSNLKILDSLPTYVEQQLKESKYRHIVKSVAYASDTFVYGDQRKQVINDPALANQAMETISNVYGSAVAPPMYGVIPDGRGDDFSYFQEEVPSVYFLIGGSNFEKGIIAMPHAPNFQVDESCISSGVSYFASLIAVRLY